MWFSEISTAKVSKYRDYFGHCQSSEQSTMSMPEFDWQGRLPTSVL